MNKKIIWVIVILLVIAGVWWWLGGSSSAPVTYVPGTSPTLTPPSSSAPSTEPTVTPPATEPPAASESNNVTVTYTDTGFSPKSVTITQGGTVTWLNQSSENLWVASAAHPSHTGYSGTSRTQHCPDTAGTAFDQCANTKEYSFTFEKVGTWPYHNHSDSTMFGTVVVAASK